MNRCSSYSAGGGGGAHCTNMVGPCSCGLFHTHQTPNSFSLLFSSFDHPHGYNQGSDFTSCPFPSPSSSAVVDCTLSLGTPSTRMSSSSQLAAHHDHHQRKPSSYNMSNFCWDILQSKPSSTHHKNGGGHTSSTTNSGGSGGSGGVDSLLARRCANCDTTSTPLWRNGPRGPKSLCNACGIRFKKEERRANAAASTNGGGGGAQAMVVESQHLINSTTSWVHHSQTTQKLPSCYSPAAAIGNEFRFIDDVDDRDSSPFLSWRLNVTDRPGLVHDFTRY